MEHGVYSIPEEQNCHDGLCIHRTCVYRFDIMFFVMQPVSDGVVLLKGKAGQRPVEFSITVDSSRYTSPSDDALPLHRLAAKAQIKQLEDAEKGSLLVQCFQLVVFAFMQSLCEFSIFCKYCWLLAAIQPALLLLSCRI